VFTDQELQFIATAILEHSKSANVGSLEQGIGLHGTTTQILMKVHKHFADKQEAEAEESKKKQDEE
jgi:hypothetical protein